MEDPKAIQNSDYLYKTPNQWNTDIPYSDPSEEELKLLEGTIKPEVLLKKEQEEPSIELTPDQKRRNSINIIKIVALNRIGLHHFMMSPYNLSTSQKKKYKKSMQVVLDEYNTDELSRDKIIKEFNEVVDDTLFSNGCDVSQYPVCDIR